MDVFSYLLGKNSSGGSGELNWSEIGFDETPSSIIDGFDYAKYIIDNWGTLKANKFSQDKRLRYFPLVDMTTLSSNLLQYYFQGCTTLGNIALIDISNKTTLFNTFSGCSGLITIPQLNTSNVSNMGSAFENCTNLKSIPLIDTSSVTNFSSAFAYCSMLTNFPLLNTSKVQYFSNMFASCPRLSDESLDNILQMCINASSYSRTKTLATLGFTSTNYPVTRIEALPHYQDFINAGWSIGY